MRVARALENEVRRKVKNDPVDRWIGSTSRGAGTVMRLMSRAFSIRLGYCDRPFSVSYLC